MKRSFKPLFINLCIVLLAALGSCKKESSTSSADTAAALQTAVASTQSIAVATNGSKDSVYIVHTCEPRAKRDSIAQSALPAAVNSYLTTNYAGYTFAKAFKVSETSGTVTGYVVVINFNGNPVGLAFDASGNFVKVLEQREGRDLVEGHGYHDGGCFQQRDGRQRDSLAISALPAAIKSYFTTNYPADTLLRAGKTRDSGYVVLSKNAGLFATVFNASGSFVSCVELPAPKGAATSIEASALPAAATSYLNTTYPGYVFNKAFAITVNGAIKGYCVAIEANSTKYGILFDATGTFVASKTIH